MNWDVPIPVELIYSKNSDWQAETDQRLSNGALSDMGLHCLPLVWGSFCFEMW